VFLYRLDFRVRDLWLQVSFPLQFLPKKYYLLRFPNFFLLLFCQSFLFSPPPLPPPPSNLLSRCSSFLRGWKAGLSGWSLYFTPISVTRMLSFSSNVSFLPAPKTSTLAPIAAFAAIALAILPRCHRGAT